MGQYLPPTNDLIALNNILDRKQNTMPTVIDHKNNNRVNEAINRNPPYTPEELAWICDNAGYLTDEERSTILQKLRAHIAAKKLKSPTRSRAGVTAKSRGANQCKASNRVISITDWRSRRK